MLKTTTDIKQAIWFAEKQHAINAAIAIGYARRSVQRIEGRYAIISRANDGALAAVPDGSLLTPDGYSELLGNNSLCATIDSILSIPEKRIFRARFLRINSNWSEITFINALSYLIASDAHGAFIREVIRDWPYEPVPLPILRAAILLRLYIDGYSDMDGMCAFVERIRVREAWNIAQVRIQPAK